MFVERLSNEEILEFVGHTKNNEIKIYSKTENGIPCVMVTLEYNDCFCPRNKLYDFDAARNAKKWRAFLYEKFGKEYIDAYEVYMKSVVKQEIEEWMTTKKHAK